MRSLIYLILEVDHVSYLHALENVEKNDFQARIKILKASSDGSILFPLEDVSATSA